jgi:hypothetical protein
MTSSSRKKNPRPSRPSFKRSISILNAFALKREGNRRNDSDGIREWFPKKNSMFFPNPSESSPIRGRENPASTSLRHKIRKASETAQWPLPMDPIRLRGGGFEPKNEMDSRMRRKGPFKKWTLPPLSSRSKLLQCRPNALNQAP